MKNLTLNQFIQKEYPDSYNAFLRMVEDISKEKVGVISLGNYCELYCRKELKAFFFATIKGRRLDYSHIVQGHYVSPGPDWKLYKGEDHYHNRAIYRLGWTGTGICLGWTRLHIGVRIKHGKEYGEYGTLLGPGYVEFVSEEQVKVFVIEPDLDDNRYYKPLYVLPEDIDV